MKLYLDGHDLEFAAQQIYMCMFPNSHAEIVPEKPGSGDYIISSLRKNDTAYSKTEINLSGEVFLGECTVPLPAGCSGEGLKRAYKRAVKTSFYNAAVKTLSSPPKWGSLTGIRPSKVAGIYLDSGKTGEEAIEGMGKDYFVSRDRAELAVACALRAKKLSDEADVRDFSLYVGIPFCASRCRYCSFVSHSIEKARGLVKPYLEMLSKELSLLGEASKKSELKLRSIYIGGGTPTALSEDELSFVMDEIAANFTVSEALEYTVEGGRPDTLTMQKIKAIRDHGATRISVNPQTMNNEILAAMDRRHTAEDVVRTISDVRKVGGLLINMDLIAGLPNDDYESFRNSVEKVLELSPENVTVHTLAIKKGSALHGESYKLPAGDETERMVDYAMGRIMESGYNPYYLYRQKYMSGNLENVGYAKEGSENLYNNYIMDELHTILSAGAGGVTKLVDRASERIERIFNPKYPYEYNSAEDKFLMTRDKIEEFFK